MKIKGIVLRFLGILLFVPFMFIYFISIVLDVFGYIFTGKFNLHMTFYWLIYNFYEFIDNYNK